MRASFRENKRSSFSLRSLRVYLYSMSHKSKRFAGFSPGQAVQQMVAPTPETAAEAPVHAPEAQGQSVPRGPLT